MATGYKMVNWVAKGMGEEQLGRWFEWSSIEISENREHKMSLHFHLKLQFYTFAAGEWREPAFVFWNWIPAFFPFFFFFFAIL